MHKRGFSFLPSVHNPWVKLGRLSRNQKQEDQIAQCISLLALLIFLSQEDFDVLFNGIIPLFLVLIIMLFINKQRGLITSAQWIKLLPASESVVVKSRLYKAFYFPTMIILSLILGTIIIQLFYRIKADDMLDVYLWVFEGALFLAFMSSRTTFPLKIMEHLVEMPRIYKMSFTLSFLSLLFLMLIPYFIFLVDAEAFGIITLLLFAIVPIILPSIFMGTAQTRLLQYGAAHKVLSKTNIYSVVIATPLITFLWGFVTIFWRASNDYTPMSEAIFCGGYYFPIPLLFVPSLIMASSYCNAKMDAWWMTTQDIDTPIEEKQIYNTPWYKSVFKKQ